ncbi:MAG: nucleotide exchange factor GrpE [Acidobacteria bacterium]|nr:nucleotide exchange factor GrpE [Acidobacteriota bacterium]
MSDPREPEVKVVDRRWWARQSAEPAAPVAAEESGASLRKPTVVEELETQLMRANDQLQAVLSEHRRASEEFEQIKVRIRRDTAREVERGRRAVLVEMLDVVDNLDRAIGAARESSSTDASETLLRGVELVREQFLSKLESFGVTRLHALGEHFDPQRHEAVSIAPVTDPSQEGLVVAVVKEGYAVGDELLRPAVVVVASRG